MRLETGGRSRSRSLMTSGDGEDGGRGGCVRESGGEWDGRDLGGGWERMENDDAETLVGMRDGTECGSDDTVEMDGDTVRPAPPMIGADDTGAETPAPELGLTTDPEWKPICVGTRGVWNKPETRCYQHCVNRHFTLIISGVVGGRGLISDHIRDTRDTTEWWTVVYTWCCWLQSCFSNVIIGVIKFKLALRWSHEKGVKKPECFMLDVSGLSFQFFLTTLYK